MIAALNSRYAIVALVVAGLLLLPVFSHATGNVFVLTLFTASSSSHSPR